MRLKVGASKWAENVGRQALLRFWKFGSNGEKS